jgi:hypothetical protein
MEKAVNKFLQDCHKQYMNDIYAQIPDFPKPYTYPDGNPVRPVLPIHIKQHCVMLIGAFPSARFEMRGRTLIPIADNLSPFGQEHYFNGSRAMVQESRAALDAKYFPRLGLDAGNTWLTDMVKIFLFSDDHVDNCRAFVPKSAFAATRRYYNDKPHQIAHASLKWAKKEITLCDPALIITLGEVAATVLTGITSVKSEKLLDGSVRLLEFGRGYNIAHVAHPEICRRNPKWDALTMEALQRLGNWIKKNMPDHCRGNHERT